MNAPNMSLADAPSLEHLGAHHLFEAQAARAPSAVAVVHEGATLTYAELDRRANQLAAVLRQRGIGVGARVALCLERSPELVVAILGALKAGAAYVPLAPTYPRDRIAFVLEDADAALVITQPWLTGLLGETSRPVLLLDRDLGALAGAPAALPAAPHHPEMVAYVMYTSGSTGAPKGVMVPHRGLTNYLAWCARAYEADQGSGSPVHSSIGFDLTITSLFAPLVGGRSVHLLPDEQRVEGLGLCLRGGRDFSLVKLTPSHLDTLAGQLDPPDIVDRTRAFVIGGEALFGEQLAFFREHAPRTRLINEYGPTETVVGCCVYEVPPGPVRPGPVPIGRPIAGTQLHVLDGAMRPVPAGSAGELYIGGAGVAHGYLNRPDLTASRFVPDPFGARPGARLYRTGDRVRLNEEGDLEFLGRTDSQVKLRGFRIELGEIEAVLAQHAAVERAVVLVREAEGARALVAFVVGKGGARPAASELRVFLKRKLLEPMVPDRFVVVDRMPITSHGKVDTRARLALADAAPPVQGSAPRPRSLLEGHLLALAEALLDGHPLGPGDDFFEHGGNSILAVRMLAQVRRSLGCAIPPPVFFEARTMGELAAVVAARAPASAPRTLTLRSAREPAPVISAHGDEEALLRLHAATRELEGLRVVATPLSGASGAEATAAAQGAQHAASLRRAVPRGPYHVIGARRGALVALEAARQLRAQGEDVPTLVLLDPAPPGEQAAAAPEPYAGKITILRTAGAARDDAGLLPPGLADEVETVELQDGSTREVTEALARRIGGGQS
ncbi:MAG: amino acid adenylation domain-containing protein [Polyangiaceae bacterium]|nr:amino acid adenylation domain-containing protein [Polyangiaceae bacterium]